ncbi:MAG: hypothetical protein GX804_03815 [Lentisphaerae bacterium]|nr:hypothetical protein [Lentisphaerota bacterium]
MADAREIKVGSELKPANGTEDAKATFDCLPCVPPMRDGSWHVLIEKHESKKSSHGSNPGFEWIST